jgi:hypothetical protein
VFGAVIELVGAVAAIVGGILFLRRAAGWKRLVGVAPLAVYATAQMVTMGHEPEQFRVIYPYALGGMVLAGALGVLLLMRAPPRRASSWEDEPLD